METLILRIEEANGEGFPLTLLQIEQGAERLRASECLPPELPGGEAMSPDALRALMIEKDSGPSRRFAEVGDHLFGLLAQGTVGDALRASKDARLYFDIRPRHLRRVPWELLRRDGRAWFADEASPCARIGAGTDLKSPAGTERLPLRILIVVGSRADDETVGAEREVRELQAALRPLRGLVDLEILKRPSAETLERTYRRLRPHVFHFIGHGGATDYGDGALLLHNVTTDKDDDWPAEAIREQLRGWAPNVAIINACRTTDHTVQEGVWGISDAFVDIGVRAVIGMQGNIRATIATDFTVAVYEALTRGRTLDVALSAARLRMRAGEGLNHRDFGLPVLQLTRRAEAVLPISHAVPFTELQEIEKTRWKDLRTFVDRSTERLTGSSTPSSARGRRSGNGSSRRCAT